MSATIPESMRLDDLLKATGYDCPAELQGKTFDQATEGGGSGSVTAYAWKFAGQDVYTYLSIGTAPSDPSEASNIKNIGFSAQGIFTIHYLMLEGDTYDYVSDTEFTISYEDNGQTVTDTYTRVSMKDMVLWG